MPSRKNNDYSCSRNPYSPDCFPNPSKFQRITNVKRALLSEQEVLDFGLIYNKGSDSFLKTRPIAFIDYLEIKKYFGERDQEIKLEKLKEVLIALSERMSFLFYFPSFEFELPSYQEFFSFLKSLGFKVQGGKLKILSNVNRRNEIIVEKETEVQLAVDLISLAHYDYFNECWLLTSPDFSHTKRYIGKYEIPVNIVRDFYGKTVNIYDPSKFFQLVKTDSSIDEKIDKVFQELVSTNPSITPMEGLIKSDLERFVFQANSSRMMIFIDFYNIVSEVNQLKELIRRDLAAFKEKFPSSNLKKAEKMLLPSVIRMLTFVREELSKGNENIESLVFMGLNPVFFNRDLQVETAKQLSEEGFKIISKDSELSRGIITEKGVDIALASFLVYHAYNHNFDKAFILSGDQDMAPSLRRLSELGKEFEIWSFSNHISSTMIEEFGEVRFLDEIFGLIPRRDPNFWQRYREWRRNLENSE